VEEEDTPVEEVDTLVVVVVEDMAVGDVVVEGTAAGRTAVEEEATVVVEGTTTAAVVEGTAAAGMVDREAVMTPRVADTAALAVGTRTDRLVIGTVGKHTALTSCTTALSRPLFSPLFRSLAAPALGLYAISRLALNLSFTISSLSRQARFTIPSPIPIPIRTLNTASFSRNTRNDLLT